MIVKLGPGNKEQVLVDTDLCIGQTVEPTACSDANDFSL